MSYSLQDLMLFSPEVYWRMVENYQTQFLVLAVAFNLGCIVVATLVNTRALRPAVMVLLAAVWAWLGWRFYIIEYASINWVAYALGVLCLGQSTLFIMLAVKLSGDTTRIALPLLFTLGYVLALRPLLMTLFGNDVTFTPVGLLPLPSLLLSIGLLHAIPFTYRWLVLLLPVTLLIAESVTLMLLNYPLWQEGPAMLVLLSLLGRRLPKQAWYPLRY